MTLDFADVKPSIINWIIVGLLASTFIVFAKWLMTKYPISGVADVINAV